MVMPVYAARQVQAQMRARRGVGGEALIEPAQAYLGVDGGEHRGAAVDDATLVGAGPAGDEELHEEQDQDPTGTRHGRIVRASCFKSVTHA